MFSLSKKLSFLNFYWTQWLTAGTGYYIKIIIDKLDKQSRKCFNIIILIFIFFLPTVFLISISIGMINGWTTPTIKILLDPTSPIHFDKDKVTIITSIIFIGSAFGSLIGGFLIEYIGTKISLLSVGLIEAIGLIILLISDQYIKSYLSICLSRLICGIASGIFFISFPLFISEMSKPNIRGALMSLISIGISLGYIAGLISGSTMTITSFSLLTILPTTIYFIIFFQLPNSPYYLLRHNNIDKAKKSIEFYQCIDDATNELNILSDFIKKNSKLTYWDVFNELMLPHNLHGIIKINLLIILMTMGGITAINLNIETILVVSKMTITSSLIFVVTVSSIGLIGGIISLLTCDKFGRKIVFSVSCVGAGCAMFCVGIYFEIIIQINDGVHDNFQWFFIINIIILGLFTNYGILTVPSMIIGELFSPNCRSLSCCIINIISGLFTFIELVIYPTLSSNDLLGYRIFFVYSFVLIIITFYTILFIPETKKKSLSDIQDMLKNKKMRY